MDAQPRAKPDAFFFYPYGIGDRDDVDYFLETFQMETGGLKHNEIKEPCEYRTKRLVFTEYDRMGCRRRGRPPARVSEDRFSDRDRADAGACIITGASVGTRPRGGSGKPRRSHSIPMS
jgi:hypothetical protein